MSSTPTLSTSILRHRMTVRQMDSEQQLIQIGHPKRHHRWLTCFAFVFRRSKSQPSSSSSSLISPITTVTTTTTSSSSSSTTTTSATVPSTPLTHPLDPLWYQHSDDNTVSEKPHPPSSSSLPTTPILSLSPPPRHTMVRQNRTRSLTPLDHSTLFTLGRSPPPPSRQSQPAVLRLSLNVDQHVSDKEDSEDDDEEPTGLFFKQTTIISTTGQDGI